jgi:hypothetical protein
MGDNIRILAEIYKLTSRASHWFLGYDINYALRLVFRCRSTRISLYTHTEI